MRIIKGAVTTFMYNENYSWVVSGGGYSMYFKTAKQARRRFKAMQNWNRKCEAINRGCIILESEKLRPFRNLSIGKTNVPGGVFRQVSIEH